MKGYTKPALTNVAWSAGLRASIRGLTFVKLAILARILAPNDFGLVAIATLVLALLEILTETGINVFLLQEKKKLQEYIDTAFVISIARGVLISLMILLFARPIAIFFNSPASYNLVLLISVVAFLRGFINPSVVKFRKELTLYKEFFLQTAIFLIDTAVAVTIAFLTRSAIGIVWGMIAGAVVEVVLTQLFITPRPKISFESKKLKKVISRGKWLTMAGIFNYLFENVDDITVGRLFTDSALGIYQVAYKLASLPITEVSTVVNRVTLPVYVKINEDIKRLKRAYLKSLTVTLLVVLPIGLILFLFPEQIVRIILGDKWLDVVTIVKIMAFFGVIRSITYSTYPVFLSLKRQDIVTRITLINLIFLCIGLLFLLKNHGLVGAGISATIGATASIPVAYYYLIRIFNKHI